MAVAVTNTALSAYNTIGSLTANPATATGANTAEVFTVTLTKACKDALLIIYNEIGGSTHGTITYSIAAGDNAFAAPAALTGSVAQGTIRAIKIDSAYISATGTIVITFTPASGKRLLTDHAMGMWVIESV